MTQTKVIDTIVRRNGVALRRREKPGAGKRGGTEILWQSADASRDWGYWYSSAKQAAKSSSSTDRVTTV